MTATPTLALDKKTSASIDAISLLEADHETVSQLFADYKSAPSSALKRALVTEICAALNLHAQVEEEIFYPAVKATLQDKLPVIEATAAHTEMKDLISELQNIDPSGSMDDTKVTLLSTHVEHHVSEEQNGLFPKVRASSLDMVELGDRMTARKNDLLAQASSTHGVTT